jgi:sugar-specific transcriptional regulator TrmB
MQDKATLIERLHSLNLSNDEAVIYLELLKEATTHLKLSHRTGINRTKVYRVVEELEKRSLVLRRTDDRGTFLTAADPASLEIDIITEEEKLKKQQSVLSTLMPMLAALQGQDQNTFIVRTYEGVEGFKQMLWHELKAVNEVMIFGSGTTEQLVPEPGLAERHRMLSAAEGYRTRELMNQNDDDVPVDFTKHQEFRDLYEYRRIPQHVLELDCQISIWNNTVSIYHWRFNQKVGVEIINYSFSQMMRLMFEYYWNVAMPPKKQEA